MSSLLLITLALLIIDRPGAAIRPMVTFTPNWENILSGDTVTLTCNVTPENQTYYWYKENELMGISQKDLTIQSASWTDIGNYQCHTSTSDISHPIRLYVSQAMLILQRPVSIHEGRPLTLKCHSRFGYKVINTTFYKEDEEIQTSTIDSESELYLKKVDGDVSGKYRCSRVIVDDDGSLHTLSCETYIHVTKAALRPVVTFKPNWRNILSGDTVTISYDVVSDDQTTQMYYWYIDEKPAHAQQQNFTIQSASWRDIGGYQCYTNISDISYPAKLNVINAALILQRPQEILEGDSLTLRCHSRSEYTVVATIFYKDDKEIKSSDGNSQLHIDKVEGAVAEKYKCTKTLQDYDGTFHSLSDETYVSVRADVRPLVIFTSNWSEILYEDPVILLCDVGSGVLEKQRYSWYKDGSLLTDEVQQSLKIHSVHREDLSDYQCRTSSGVLSPRVTLNASASFLILQRPPVIYAGDPLTLRCHSSIGFEGINTTFYKEDKEIKFSVNDSELHIVTAVEGSSGKYKCTKLVGKNNQYHIYNAETYISVLGRSSSGNGFDHIIIAGATIGTLVAIFILFLIFFWKCRNKKTALSSCQEQQVTSAPIAAAPDEDICYIFLNMDHLQTASSTSAIEIVDATATYAVVKHRPH
ncbi:Fc receptor-like protein 4 [Phyllobates terribilis]|uniref:Fc receptor-like protein 4 n=1 Tax=Phyllobates terribilis TaxID=111132 RepID=UPI003CCAD03E